MTVTMIYQRKTLNLFMEGHADGDPEEARLACAKLSLVGDALTETVFQYLGDDSNNISYEAGKGFLHLGVKFSGLSTENQGHLLLIFEQALIALKIVKQQFPKSFVLAKAGFSEK